MYEIFEELCKMRGITPYKFCKEMQVDSSTISTWKKNNSLARPDLAKKVCDFFGISMDYLMNGKKPEEKEITLTPRDERDISKKLQDTLEQLENSQEALMFDGIILDENTRELLKASIENSMRIAKINAKQKFTPKKYRGNQ